MKTILRYINTIALLCFVALCFWLWDFFSPEKITSPDAEVRITAKKIENILEMNAAKQIVTSEYTDSIQDIAYNIKLGPLKMSSYLRTNILKENRTWEVKAGSSDFKIVDSELFIKEPGITSCEELSEQREIIIMTGVWSPVAIKAAAIKSKSMAKVRALEMGIVESAKLKIESEFAKSKIDVVWIK